MNAKSSPQKLKHPLVYTRKKVHHNSSNHKNGGTYNGMNPSCWDKHRIPRIQCYFHDFVDHVTKPRIILQLCTRPTFIRCKVSRGWSDEVEYLHIIWSDGDSICDNKDTHL